MKICGLCKHWTPSGTGRGDCAHRRLDGHDPATDVNATCEQFSENAGLFRLMVGAGLLPVTSLVRETVEPAQESSLDSQPEHLQPQESGT